MSSEATLGLNEAPGCPFHGSADFDFQNWLQKDLLCSAGKREFRHGRYQLARIRNGQELKGAIDKFRDAVKDHSKTGMLSVLDTCGRRFENSFEELSVLGDLMFEAGLCSSAEAVVDGETVVVEIETVCPVTAIPTVYSFFPVAFCQSAANPADELYDPSLSAPFTGINMTSDAFAFALLVRDQSIRLYGAPPSETCVDANRKLFHHSVTTWQNMSANTISSYNKRSACPERAVHLSDDRRSWFAAHNDPVFAERRKEVHSHEMPVVYAQRLCDIWLSALTDRHMPAVGREGQSGGVLVG
ncbi:hypothetical protein [Flaviflagellibacter deserti]|uniref:Uncharacterized protein n=1 Tax=Flaviflagellibacter deserti TaxID=2267266 RepID=A0ABV9YWT7_9HYPH